MKRNRRATGERRRGKELWTRIDRESVREPEVPINALSIEAIVDEVSSVPFESSGFMARSKHKVTPKVRSSESYIKFNDYQWPSFEELAPT